MFLPSTKILLLTGLFLSLVSCGGGNTKDSVTTTEPADDLIQDGVIAAGRGEPPIVFWPKPIQAHPNVPFEFTMVAYDKEHDLLLYSLSGAPSGMTINTHGTIHWTPDAVNSPYTFNVNIDDGRNKPVTVAVELRVDAANYFFVAVDGHDGNTGSLTSPFATIEKGLRELATLPSGTLYIRGGTYAEHWNWNVNGVSSPLRGKNGTANAPYVVRGYPNETAILDSEGQGHGYWSFQTSYVLFADLEVRNASAPERGGAIIDGSNNIMQNVRVSDSNWSSRSNCTGFLLRGSNSVCHRCKAINNYDRTSDLWNSSNFLLYPEGRGQDLYILDSYSSGSITGYKIKHAGNGRVILHGSLEEGSRYGWAGIDDKSSVRFNTFVGNETAISIGISDPNIYTQGDMLVEYNTVVDATTSYEQRGGYGALGGTVVRHNIFVNKMDSPTMSRVWPYLDPDPAMLESDYNCWFTSMGAEQFRMGASSYDFTGWQALGLDQNSVVANPDFVAASYRLSVDSGCKSKKLRIGAWE